MYRDGDAPEGTDLNRAVEWFAEGLNRGHARSGANAAYLIQTRGASNYDAFDAAVFAARGAALTGNIYAGEAAEVLAGMSGRDIDGGAQRLIVELGGEIAVDGAFGPTSEAAYQVILDRLDAGPVRTDPQERILHLAALSWQSNPFRVDLY